jgi:hypothetical protein
MKAEQLLDNSISKIKKHPAKIQDILSRLPDQTEQIKIAHSLFTIPKKSIPEPIMQRKFMLAPIPDRHVTFIMKLSRWTTVGIAGFVLMVVGFTAYAASNSLPGQTLFKVKRAAEQVQLSLTTDPVKKANLQLSFTQRRLAEAQTVFSLPASDNDQKFAALNELAGQTKTAVDEVKSIATTQKINSPLVASLQDVAAKQKVLLNQVKKEDAVTKAPSDVLAQATENQVQVNEIIKIIAASSDESPAALATTSTSTVLTILPKETVAATSSGTSSTLTLKKLDPEKHVTGSSSIESSSESPADSNTAVGSFIIEDPRPQIK